MLVPRLWWLLATFAGAGAAFSASTVLTDRDEMRESVVRIEVEHPQGIRQGTGFLINDRRTIATNNHVVDGAKSLNVTFLANGKPMSVPARLIATDPAKDLALIETVADIYADPIPLANYDTHPPAKVSAIGYPVAADFVAGGELNSIMLEPSHSVGTVARIVSNAKLVGGARLIQHTAAVNPGNSGGPLFDECGRVIGINTLRTPPKEFDFPQGIFFAVDIRELQSMLADEVIGATRVDAPCTPDLDTRNDLPPAATKQAEAEMFDRFAACMRVRPCDATLCRSRYQHRVAPELASARQSDIDLRLSMSEQRCRDHKETEALAEFHRCTVQQPCAFEATCRPKLEEALASESMRLRRTLFERSRSRAEADCKAAEAPGVWQGSESEQGVWMAAVKNEKGAVFGVRCDISGPLPGSGGIVIGDAGGKRDRWAGTRSVQMTIDGLSEPLRLDLQASAGALAAAVKHVESVDTRGWLKELVGKLSVGSVVTFEEPRVGLDETFALNGAARMLAPCLNARFAEPQQ